jgi:hypothetical protein
MTFQKMLCPVDFSLGSQQALLLAVRLANESAAELVLTHVWHVPPLAYADEPPFPADMLQALIEDEQRGLAAAAAEASRLGARRVTTKLLTGVPWAQLVDLLSWGRMAGPACAGRCSARWPRRWSAMPAAPSSWRARGPRGSGPRMAGPAPPQRTWLPPTDLAARSQDARAGEHEPRLGGSLESPRRWRVERRSLAMVGAASTVPAEVLICRPAPACRA